MPVQTDPLLWSYSKLSLREDGLCLQSRIWNSLCLQPKRWNWIFTSNVSTLFSAQSADAGIRQSEIRCFSQSPPPILDLFQWWYCNPIHLVSEYFIYLYGRSGQSKRPNWPTNKQSNDQASIYPRLLTRLNYCPSTFDLFVNPFQGSATSNMV